MLKLKVTVKLKLKLKLILKLILKSKLKLKVTVKLKVNVKVKVKDKTKKIKGKGKAKAKVKIKMKSKGIKIKGVELGSHSVRKNFQVLEPRQKLPAAKHEHVVLQQPVSARRARLTPRSSRPIVVGHLWRRAGGGWGGARRASLLLNSMRHCRLLFLLRSMYSFIAHINYTTTDSEQITTA